VGVAEGDQHPGAEFERAAAGLAVVLGDGDGVVLNLDLAPDAGDPEVRQDALGVGRVVADGQGVAVDGQEKVLAVVAVDHQRLRRHGRPPPEWAEARGEMRCRSRVQTRVEPKP
jgi:hypothetical protein